MTVKEKLSDVLCLIGIGEISIQYFKKTPSWLYQRLNGAIVNGKSVELSPAELEELRSALYDLSERIRRAADGL